MMGASDLTESVKLEAEFQNENHPYIRAYIQKRGRIADEDSILNNSEQRAYDMELMKEFYREDIKVASIIQKYQPEMMLPVIRHITLLYIHAWTRYRGMGIAPILLHSA